MNINQLVKQIAPPFMYAALDRVHRTRKYPLFGSYQDALAYCSKDGYENEVLIDVLTYKMENYLNTQKVNADKSMTPTQSFTLLALTKVIAAHPNVNNFNILDFGGNLGGHYYDIKRFFGKGIKLKWAVVETPALAKAGEKFANDELQFFHSIEAATQYLGTIDLLHTSGTLQCVEKPKVYLDKLLTLNANHILFNRMGLNRKNVEVVTIHHSKLSWNGHAGLPPNVEDRVIRYPFTFMSEKYFYDTLAQKHQIEARFSDNTGILEIPSEDIIGGGLLFSRIA